MIHPSKECRDLGCRCLQWAGVLPGLKVVLANGCFDILHAGHVRHLQAARAMGDRLVVALTVDDAVNKGPGLPIHVWELRATVLRALRCVDDVVPSRSDIDALRAVRPAVFVKGIDYLESELMLPARAVCAAIGTELRFTTTAKLSSREIAKRMRA